MFLKMGFDGTIELSYIGLTIRTGNLVNSLVDNWVIFVFSTFEKLFEGFMGFEKSFSVSFG